MVDLLAIEIVVLVAFLFFTSKFLLFIPIRYQSIILLLSSFLCLISAAFLEVRDKPATINILENSAATHLSLQNERIITSLDGASVSSRRELIANALKKQGEKVLLSIDNQEYSLLLGKLPPNAVRQSSDDIDLLFSGIQLFSERPILWHKPHPLLWEQRKSLDYGVMLSSINGKALPTKADLKILFKKMNKQEIFLLQFLEDGQTQDSWGNFSQEPFADKASSLQAKLRYVGLSEYPHIALDAPPGIFLNGNPYVKSFALKKIPTKESKDLHLFRPFQSDLIVPITPSIRSAIAQYGFLQRPSLAFPIAYTDHSEPLHIATHELGSRVKRIFLPSNYQLSLLHRAWEYLPMRWYEIRELYWQNISYWLCQLAQLFLLGTILLPLFHILDSKWKRAAFFTRYAFSMIALFFFLHDLFLLRVWQ